ncbi:Gfo/Idh/MocA family protein [Phyllobacterium zundukense]|uniref:Oxidoreductase n=1 Tax=Phyllobacterium zundukense TaxID=1867719 RepID=A0A2N9VX37_9HYPH|nr:Gfo/Idh/MocA family oxidoreductase [Phyllobacterium zundukense]ATU90315.1 oxidoreductase [Phyllobacterium zundukense]PIO44055.1 oxidoreductase [Phyllobacterium zundukense]
MSTSRRNLRIGVVGCGNISMTYLRNSALFRGIKLAACADISTDMAQLRASEYGIRAQSVDELLKSEDIDLVLNLTIPTAHFDISMSALSAGKHVFTEKPLAVTAVEGRTLVAEARSRNLLIGSAPDTFLGAAGRLARRFVDGGRIGRPVTGTAFMMGRGMEHWHPNPQFYYQPGGGPVLDMGPYYITMLVNLIGPAKRVVAMSSIASAERLITADGPFKGTSFKVGTPTTIQAVVEFVNGAVISIGMSWDVFKHSNHPIELHGTEGSLRLPDPDTFGGVLALSERGSEWQEFSTADSLHGQINWPFNAPDRANYRMIGVADLANAIATGGKPRASGDLALHVLEVMEAILEAGATGKAIDIPGSGVQPAALPEDEAAALGA